MIKHIQKVVDRKATLNGKPRTLRGFAMQLDSAVWMVIAAIIIAAVVVGAIHMTNESRLATARLEMDQLRSAIIQYESYKEKPFSGNWNLLFIEITDTSGDRHRPLLQKKGRWSGGSPKDPWSKEYIYDETNRQIICHNDGDIISVKI